MDTTKRKDIIINAFREVVNRGYDNCLLFIGGGPENEIFKELTLMLKESPELENKVFLLGYIPQEMMPILFSYCDIYVSASEMEGFGMSVAQAAFDAKPIVSSKKIPFTSFYLANEAIIVDEGDINGFADGIELYLKDETLRKEKGRQSRKKAISLEWEKLTIQFIRDLNKLNFDIPITRKFLATDS